MVGGYPTQALPGTGVVSVVDCCVLTRLLSIVVFAMAMAIVWSFFLPFTLFWIAWSWYYRFRRVFDGNTRRPPGPPPLPVIGNLLDMPTTNMGAHYAQLVKKYGMLFPIRSSTIRI